MPLTSKTDEYCFASRRVWKRFVLILIFFTTCIFLGISPLGAARHPVIQVGIFQNRPIVFQDEKEGPQGLYVDLLRKIAAKEGWKIEFLLGSWSEGLERLRMEKIDLMTSIAYTEERDAHMDFSNENVLMMWGQVYVKPDSGIQNILDLKRKKVAILKNGINGINFRKLCDKFNIRCQIVIKDSYAQVFELVAEGKVSAGVANNIHGDVLARDYGLQRSPILFSPFSLLFAVPEMKHSELLSSIDNQLADWKRDENSFYYEAIDHWFGGDTVRKYHIPRWAIFTLFITCGLLLFFLIWFYILRRQVKAQTSKIGLSEDSLRESEERFNIAVKGSYDGLWDWPDIKQNEEWWSARLYELLGYKDGEVKASASNFKALLHPDDYP